MTRLRRAAVLAAVVALLAAINPRAAYAYPEQGFWCDQWTTGGGIVTVNWPSLTSVSGGAEHVYFLALLYRWQNGSWQPYQVTPAAGASYVGVSNSAGRVNLGTIDNPRYFSVGGAWPTTPVFVVPAGTYAVLEYYGWENNSTSSQWATLQSNNARAWYHPSDTQYCTIQ
jgi:hypothetical protein